MYDVAYIGNLIEFPTLNSFSINPNSLLKCRGEIGNFELRCKDDDGKIKEISSASIIINIDAETENPVPDTLSFDDELTESKEFKEGEAIVFVQDYLGISPAIMSQKGLNKALSLLNKFSDTQIYYLYRSMRFIEDNDELFEKARKSGIVFLKYEDGSLNINDSGELLYEREDLSITFKENLIFAPDLKPSGNLSRIARVLNLEMDPSGYLQVENVYLQPTLTGKRGVYVLGGSRGPTAYSNYEEEVEYTLNEIKANLNNLKPVVSDERVIDDQKCILCYTCYRICPHGAIERDEKLDAMKINQMACQGCNACISHCPAKAISIRDVKEKTIESGLKVLMCENSAKTAWEKLDKKQFDDLKIEMIPCASSIQKEDIIKELSNPNDRLLILGCFEESCKHLYGDQRAERIVNEVKDTLKKLDLGEDRLTFERLSPRLADDLNDYLSKWKEGVTL
jgi:ferredoxin